jgi:hypothetical protein
MNKLLRGFLLAILAMGAGLAGTSKPAAAADVWSSNCTPDVIQVFQQSIVARCQQTGVWYEIATANRPEAFIDRILRTLEAAELSGKTVQFRDVGVSSINTNNRAFDAVALNR